MNNPKDMLVSNEWLDAEEGADFNAEMEFTGDEKTADLSSTKWRAGAECIRAIYEAELTKLRSESDELVGALRATWNALEASPCDPDITADQIAAHAEMNKHNVPALLAKHKPE